MLLLLLVVSPRHHLAIYDFKRIHSLLCFFFGEGGKEKAIFVPFFTRPNWQLSAYAELWGERTFLLLLRAHWGMNNEIKSRFYMCFFIMVFTFFFSFSSKGVKRAREKEKTLKTCLLTDKTNERCLLLPRWQGENNKIAWQKYLPI